MTPAADARQKPVRSTWVGISLCFGEYAIATAAIGFGSLQLWPSISKRHIEQVAPLPPITRWLKFPVILSIVSERFLT